MGLKFSTKYWCNEVLLEMIGEYGSVRTVYFVYLQGNFYRVLWTCYLKLTSFVGAHCTLYNVGIVYTSESLGNAKLGP
jgi:hypothetical protein